MKKTTTTLLALTLILSNCGVDHNEHNKIVKERDSLVARVESLTKEIDKLKHGEQRIIGLIEHSLSHEDYITAEIRIQELDSYHPESSKNNHYQKILHSISKQLQKQKELINKKKQDSIKLANINNLGIWKISYFVDDFGERTKEGYITTSIPIYGYFSNSATENSRLRVRFIIANKKDIAIQLYEYAGNNPVKEEDTDYIVKVKDKNGKTHYLNAVIYKSDRLRFGSSSNCIYPKYENKNAELMHNILLSGGTIQFYIEEFNRSSTKYKFSINADWYENAYIKLSSIAK